MSKAVVRSSSANPQARKRIIKCAIALIILCAIVLDSKVIKIGSQQDMRKPESSIEKYGISVFPDIQKNIESRAIPASKLAKLLKENRQQTAEKYGTGSAIPVFPVSFTGIVTEGKMGIYTISVTDIPASLQIRLQTGPVITGTDLRDATGNIHFGDFKNQIEYQNAAASINQEMKRRVLISIDTDSLSGKTVKIVGVFRLLNQDNWLVTPVRINIQ